MVEKPPTLGPDEKERHLIAHDEVCFHANDLSRTEWVADGEQPLRQKGRGRIVHVSDFIIERTGRLCLTEREREAQMKLKCAPKAEPAPAEPAPAEPSEPRTIGTQPVAASNTPPTHPTTGAAANLKKAAKERKKGVKKARKKKSKDLPVDEPVEPIGTSAGGRTFAENSNWNPGTSPSTGEGPYRLPSFDARRIIYPGANGDPWWDMPQLIAQVSNCMSCRSCPPDSTLDKGRNLYI